MDVRQPRKPRLLLKVKQCSLEQQPALFCKIQCTELTYANCRIDLTKYTPIDRHAQKTRSGVPLMSWTASVCFHQSLYPQSHEMQFHEMQFRVLPRLIVYLGRSARQILNGYHERKRHD